MSGQFFPYEVAEQLKAYVYRLIDPRNGETFYVGKGRGNRVFQHALEAEILIDQSSDIMGPKLDLIREIQRDGHMVDYVIHRHGMDDDTAFQVEAALIDAYPSLRNAVRGHHASIKGLATVDDILHRYNLPTVELSSTDKLLLIKINKINGGRDPKDIFRLVHYCWDVNSKRAAKADYILALDRGVIIGAFVADEWLSAIPKNFPDLPYCDGSEAIKWGFRGKRAPQAIIDRYVGSHGKRLTNLDLKSQKAFRYWNC